MVSFIDEYRDPHGVEPICEQLPIAPSAYYAHKAKEADPDKRSIRAKRDDELLPEIQRVWDENLYDNALAETINGLYKTEVIRHKGLWRTLENVEYATLLWVDWFNNRRLLEPIGYIPPAEYEAAYYTTLEESAKVEDLTLN